MSLVSQMFGLASSVAYIRCGGSGNNTQLVLESIASGFGANTSDGTYTYNLFLSNTGTGAFSNVGFDNSSEYYTNLENQVPNMGGYSKIGTAAIIFSYALFPNIPETGVVNFINSYCQATKNLLYEPGYTINTSGIDYVMSQFTLTGVLAGMTGAPAVNTSPAINYNWYNSRPLFTNPDFNPTLIRDVESQYYYVSGQVLYNGLPTGLSPCISYNITIQTPTGSVVIPVLQNVPCYDKNTYVGPTSGIKFFREFSDGPGTSGYFDTAMIGAYSNFDKAVMSYADYSSNNSILYSNQTDSNGNYIYLISGVQTDTVGFYNPENEYGIGHTNFIDTGSQGCGWTNYFQEGVPFMRMHEGDNRPKLYYNKICLATDGDGHCIECGYTGSYNAWTGWKIVTFELDSSFAKNYSSIKTNPILDTGRVLKRVLNTDNYAIEGGAVSPYLNVSDTGDGTLTCDGTYVGPPQLNGTATLPGLVFWQTFDNTNFPDYATIDIRPAFLSGEAYNISNFDLFTGENGNHYLATSATKAKVNISKTINSSGISQYDDVFKKCFAIGDNFQNTVSSTASVESNAGFFYTGYSYEQSGEPISAGELLALNTTIIGGQYSQLNYIQGYQSGIRQYYVSDQYAFLITGDTSTGINYTGPIVRYSYFNNGILGALNTGWLDTFAPVPSIVGNNYLNVFNPIYQSQSVENYMPRYSSGPFLTYQSQFLYPNANQVSLIYNSNHKGFPVTVNYALTIKEETVREVFAISGLGGDFGNHAIIRAGSDGQPLTLPTTMASPFVPNNLLYQYTYNWLENTSLYPVDGSFFYEADFADGYVNQDYIPQRNGCPQTNLNSVIYGSNNYLFNQGVKYTGQVVYRSIHTGGNITTGILVTEPAGGGVYWGYTSRQITGQMVYVPPIFDLSTLTINPTAQLTGSMISSIVGATYPAFSNNGSVRYGNLYDSNGNYNGKDPLFYEYVGGRSGLNAQYEGGYHDKGIIGDAWYQVTETQWGQERVELCGGDGETWIRYPQNDQYLTLASLTSTGLGLFIRGMSYYPYYLNWQYQPFMGVIGSIGVNTTTVQIGANNSQLFFDFNLEAYFPYNTTLTGDFYSTSGLTIGPFDRDVEFCVTGKNSIIPSGYLIVDGEILTDPTQNGNGCTYNNIENFTLNSGIILGQGGRGQLITTFKLIPSGATTNINISGTGGPMGLTGNSIATIRPRTCFGAVVPNDGGNYPYLLSGDVDIMNSFPYLNNGSENLFNFPQATTFETLSGQTLSMVTNIHSEVIFPTPGSDFDEILNPIIDVYGNKTYRQQHPTLSYWKVKSPNTYYTGIREVSRVYISIDSMSSQMGQVPYQTFTTIIPSGSCTISGIFAYTGEAESAIVSDGIYLSGVSGASSLENLYTPLYISNVLQRLPTGIMVLPSGGGISPVLPAPSLMMERKNIFQITGNDTYVGVSPTGLSYYYNAFLWPAWSDLALLNPTVVYEQMPPDDGNTFLGSYLTFSASKGQPVGTGFNPIENVTYQVNAQYAFLDSTSTDALYNSGKCVFSGIVTQTTLNSGNLSGILAIEGQSLTLAMDLI